MHSVYALRIHCMAGRVVWSADSIFGSATFTTDSSMRDIDDPSRAAASTHSFRAAHAGTDRVARIVTSSQGREVALDIACGSGRKEHERYTCLTRNSSPSSDCNTSFLSSAQIRAGAPQQR